LFAGGDQKPSFLPGAGDGHVDLLGTLRRAYGLGIYTDTRLLYLQRSTKANIEPGVCVAELLRDVSKRFVHVRVQRLSLALLGR
jgi:hypothetical protein